MFLLDSNLISELRSARRCHPKVRAWQKVTRLDLCFLSVVTIAEIREGIELVKKKDPSFASALENWLATQVKRVFAQRILRVSVSVAEGAGRIAALRTRGLADCLIAATACKFGLTLVTRNTADFDDISGLKILNPWEG